VIRIPYWWVKPGLKRVTPPVEPASVVRSAEKQPWDGAGSPLVSISWIFLSNLKHSVRNDPVS